MYESNTILDGLSTIKNMNFKFNDETGLLDVSGFDCLYEPVDKTLTPYIAPPPPVKRGRKKAMKFL